MDESTPAEKRVKRINAYYDYAVLIEHFEGYKPNTDTILCPFHEDSRKSAKIYHDNDGDRVHCFTESRQYTVVDYLVLQRQELSKWDPNVEPTKKENKAKLDLTPLKPFKTGDISMKEFFRRLASL